MYKLYRFVLVKNRKFVAVTQIHGKNMRNLKINNCFKMFIISILDNVNRFFFT